MERELGWTFRGAPNSPGTPNSPNATHSGVWADLSGFENSMETLHMVLKMVREGKR